MKVSVVNGNGSAYVDAERGSDGKAAICSRQRLPLGQHSRTGK
jgi:hypothetical protein